MLRHCIARGHRRLDSTAVRRLPLPQLLAATAQHATSANARRLSDCGQKKQYVNKEKIILSWSGGKDCAYALYQLMQSDRYEVAYLLSTFNGTLRRLSMHGVPEALIAAQADAIGLPLLKVYVYESSNAEYEQQMGAVLEQAYQEGIRTVAFGDIFLADLRAYREEKMRQVGMGCIFPLWQKDTLQLVNDFIGEGFVSMTCCINDGYLTDHWLGRIIDNDFVQQLPSGVDPCGENGEFHSFCMAGPIFKQPLAVRMVQSVYRPLPPITTPHPTPIKDVGTKGFWYGELELQ
jgi:uncharacterized protein (TIGR00290 family)